VIRTLPRLLAAPEGKPVPFPGTADVFRAFARELAAGRRPWTPETASFIAGQFDGLAAAWDTTRDTGRDDPLRDALARGAPLPAGRCLEAGCGTGQYTPLLATVFPTVASVDLSEQMLRQAAGSSPTRIQADASRLPFASASMAAVAAVDMLLFRPRRLASCGPTASCCGSTSSV